MPPRVVRPRTDSALLPLTLGGTVACLVAGWFLGAWIFKPAHAPAAPEATSDGNGDVVVEPARPDASAPPPPRDAGPPVVTVPVTVNAGLLSACGDGEEMDLPGARCDAPAGLEPALRARLQSVLGACPAAASAAREPSKALSLGLRVDFARRRVVSLLGRSTTVPDKVSYVPCVNNTLGALDDVWRIQAAHPRYQYFFTARFGPLRGPTPAAPDAPAPTPAPTPAAPDASVTDPSLPTPAQMLRMPAMTQATVTWSTAIVRETPRTGPVAARLPQGTAVEVVDRRGSWYGIRWQRVHAGWTYGDAIGQGR